MMSWARAEPLALAVVCSVAACGGTDSGGAETSPGTAETGTSSSGTPLSSTGAETGPGASGSTTGTSSSGSPEDTGSSSEPSPTGSSSGSTGPSAESSTGGADRGLGALGGECGVLDAVALTGEQPGFIVNTLDFGDVGFDYDLLTPGGQAVYDAGNLGGSSLFSEVIAFDVLARCDAAELLKTETEIEYDAKGTRTDLLVEFDGTKIGVSVTRGQGFPLEDPYSVEQALVLLEDKLSDIPMSTANVSPVDAWEKQILHILAYGPMHAESLQTAYETLGPELTLDTLVVVTVTDGDDLFIYTE